MSVLVVGVWVIVAVRSLRLMCSLFFISSLTFVSLKSRNLMMRSRRDCVSWVSAMALGGGSGWSRFLSIIAS